MLEAAGGAEGLALLVSRPDVRLVFSDVMMPGTLDGHDVEREVHLHHPGVAVLLTSGYVTPSKRPERIRREAAPMLAKPYDQAALASAVAAALECAGQVTSEQPRTCPPGVS